MTSSRDYIAVSVTQKGEKALRSGHPWVYADEVTGVFGAYENGDIVDVVSAKGKYLGSGFINDNSKIRVRVFSTNASDRFDAAFFARRVKHAVDYRKTVMGDDFSNCRLIFGEADMFPGLTVDRFENVLVAQVLSLGIEKRKDIIFGALVSALREAGEKIDAIYERNEADIRELEGMEKYKGFYRAQGLRDDLDGTVKITENGIIYNVDYINGQKTGFFLDQKYNRAATAKISRGKTVLDCFTHTGAFGLNCAAAGAKKVVSVDISRDACNMAYENACLNGLQDRVAYVCEDVFDLLTELSKGGRHEYDMIILDPPAFTKSRSTIKNAVSGYKEINLKAMKLLPRGGYLATCSCSHFMSNTLFKQMLHDAAADAGVGLRQIEERHQSPDHPILWNVPETDYLKFYIFQIV